MNEGVWAASIRPKFNSIQLNMQTHRLNTLLNFQCFGLKQLSRKMQYCHFLACKIIDIPFVFRSILVAVIVVVSAHVSPLFHVVYLLSFAGFTCRSSQHRIELIRFSMVFCCRGGCVYSNSLYFVFLCLFLFFLFCFDGLFSFNEMQYTLQPFLRCQLVNWLFTLFWAYSTLRISFICSMCVCECTEVSNDV